MSPTLNVSSPTATVSISRSAATGLIDLTVMCTLYPEGWKITVALDEEGNEIALTPTEELLATCLVQAGVDETGR